MNVPARDYFFDKSGQRYKPLSPRRQELALSCLNWAKKLAVEYSKRFDEDIDDCISAAFEGLCRAAAMFDFDRNKRFTTYSAWWIRSCLQYQTQKMAPFGARGPQCRLPSIDSAISLRMMTEDDTSGELFDHLTHGMEKRERVIVRRYFYEGWKDGEIAKRHHCSKRTVWRVIGAARERMREQMVEIVR